MTETASSNPSSPEWVRRRKTNWILFGFGAAGFAACIVSAILGRGSASIDNGMFVSAGLMAAGAGLYVFQGLSRLKASQGN